MNYIKVSEFLPENTCDYLLRRFYEDKIPQPMPLNDNSEDMLNVIYSSTRSSLTYQYLSLSHRLGNINQSILDTLEGILCIPFNSPTNQICMPMFVYSEGGFMKPHKDVEKVGKFRVQNYVAMIMLTQRGVDFSGGKFFVNFDATSSKDGKEVVENESARYYPDLNKGDLFLWDNRSSVHGCTPVTGVDSIRATIGFRTLQVQTPNAEVAHTKKKYAANIF